MIELVVFDGKRNRTLEFEHSLVSMSKWESKHQIAFQGRQSKSPEQMIDYFQMMLVSRKVDPTLVYRLSPAQNDELTNYINSSRTATEVPKEKSTGIPETMTSELIYYWLTELRIPFQPTDSWHLSRTIALVQLTAFKKAPPKKRRPSDVMSDWRRDNENNKRILGIKD